MVDNCDNCQGFIINHSVGGGTGSGLGALILERLAVNYRKKTKVGFDIYPFQSKQTSNTEIYNALLSTHWLLDHTELSVLLDNKQIYNLCKSKLKIKRPNYNNMNNLIRKVCSAMTSSLRFEGELNVDLNEFQTNLVPFPRLHFLLTSLSPIIPLNYEDKKRNDVQGITERVFLPDNFLVELIKVYIFIMVYFLFIYIIKCYLKKINIWLFH